MRELSYDPNIIYFPRFKWLAKDLVRECSCRIESTG